MRIKKKNILLKEVANTNHEIERLKSRFSVFTPEDLDNADKVKILRNISLLNNINLNPRESYGVRLGDFKINPKSKYYFNIRGREYYRLNNELVKDSTGNEFWVVVRNNRITTFMLRKDVQSNNEDYLKEKLRVNNIIFDLNTNSVSEDIVSESDDLAKSMIAFHGSPVEINNFSDEFVGGKDANDAVGPGVYFTTSKEDASGYGEYVYNTNIDTSKFLAPTPIKKDYSKQLIKLIKMSDDWVENAQNYDENPERGVIKAVKGYHDYDDNVKDLFLSVWIDFYKYDAINFVRNMVKIGYDGIIIDGYNRNPEFKHLIVYNLGVVEISKDVKENIDEELIDEDFKSQTSLPELANFMIETYVEQFVDYTISNGNIYRKNFIADSKKNIKGNFGVLNRFLYFFKLEIIMTNLTGVNGFFKPTSPKSGMIVFNVDEMELYEMFKKILNSLDGTPNKNYVISKMSSVIKNSKVKTTMIHELQHAYDYFISNGKYTSDKKSKEFYKQKTDDNVSDSGMREKYLKLKHEINARFSQTIENLDYEVFFTNENGDEEIGFIELKDYINNFKKDFVGWDLMTPKIKKYLFRRVSQYYYKFKEIFDEKYN